MDYQQPVVYFDTEANHSLQASVGSIMSGMAKTFILSIIILALCSPAPAEIYKYRDANGRLVFVDDKDKIPTEFRGETSSVTEADGSLGSFDSPDLPQEEITPPEVTEETQRPAKKKSKYQTDVVINGNRVLVPAEASLGNRTVKLTLLLDTGATRTVFHRNALSELDLPKGKAYKARIAGGGTLRSSKIRFKHIKVGPYKMPKAYAMVINLEGKETPFDGMLGMDFLKSHPYQIDFKNQVITWDKVE